MRTAISLTASSLLLFVFAVPAKTHPWGGNPYGVTNLNGVWFMNGNEELPCRIVQRRPDTALFINEHGQQAVGRIGPERVFIPDWNDGYGSDGLEGRIRGELIIWPNGSFWSRY